MLGKVEEWERSGLSLGAFANKNGFSKTGFGYWVKKKALINDNKSITFEELSPGTKTGEIAAVLSESLESAPQHGSIVITFPGGMIVKIYG